MSAHTCRLTGAITPTLGGRERAPPCRAPRLRQTTPCGGRTPWACAQRKPRPGPGQPAAWGLPRCTRGPWAPWAWPWQRLDPLPGARTPASLPLQGPLMPGVACPGGKAHASPPPSWRERDPHDREGGGAAGVSAEADSRRREFGAKTIGFWGECSGCEGTHWHPHSPASNFLKGKMGAQITSGGRWSSFIRKE